MSCSYVSICFQESNIYNFSQLDALKFIARLMDEEEAVGEVCSLLGIRFIEGLLTATVVTTFIGILKIILTF